MSLKPWWQVAVPHKDIREGRLDEAIFAASLGDVHQGRGPLDYLDAETFFKKTYFTSGLTNLIEAVLRRLAGKGAGDAVIQIQTPFGGGKTHALLALYHTFKFAEKTSRIDFVKKILGKNKITEIPEAKVVVFVGEYADPLKGRTLWGEIAYQLGSYELLEEYDKKKIAPSKELIAKILSRNVPVLILIDELLQYLVRTLGVPVEEGTLKGQVQAFLKALTEVVALSERVALIATLPSSVSEGFEETEKAERLLSEVQRIFGRVERIYTPVEGEEVYEIIRKRLFEDLGDVGEHESVAEEYFSLYQKLGEDIPAEFREVAYRKKIVKAYPFHPELIDILFERWGTLPTFQRTRGVLRLLAEVVADLFKREHPAPLIQPAHINLGNAAIRREFVKHIGNEFEGVIASDLDGPGAKAPRLDREMGTEYSKFKVATGLATSIFFYSFSGSERKGVTAQRLRLAFLRPGVPQAIVADALRRLEEELWFLHFEKNLYYFSSVVGLNRVIIDKEEAIKEEEIETEIRRRLERIAGTDFKVYVWPKASADVPDNKELKLVMLPLGLPDGKAADFLREFINKYSTGFRTYKNTILFLLSDANELEALMRSTRRFLALYSVVNDRETMGRLTQEDKERVGQKLREAEASLPIRILSTYRFVAKASRDGIKRFDMGIPTVGDRPILTRRVKEYLKEQDVLLLKISPKVLFERTFSRDDERKNLVEVLEAFAKFPEMPILEGEHVVKSAVVEGVLSGVFGVIMRDGVKFKEAASIPQVSEEVVLVRSNIAEQAKQAATGEPSRPAPTAPAGPEIPAPSLSKMIGSISLRVKVPIDRLSDFVRGVVAPLRREGAEISLELRVQAKSEAGIKRDTIDQQVKETLSQIGAEVLEEKEE